MANKSVVYKISLRKKHFTVANPFMRTDSMGGNCLIVPLDDSVEKLGEAVVLKVFYNIDKKNSQERFERFKREIEITKGLVSICKNEKANSCCVEILGSSTPKSFASIKSRRSIAWYAMPLCQTYDINQKHSLEDVVSCLDQILKCIEFIHNHKYSHRDIKVSNILRNKKGQWVLSDYGLAFNPSLPRITNDNDIAKIHGGPPFLKKLKPSNDPAIDEILYEKGDIYLFGKLCWQLITGLSENFIGSFTEESSAYKEFINKSQENNEITLPLFRLCEEAINDDPSKIRPLEEIRKRLDLQIKTIHSEHNNSFFCNMAAMQCLAFFENRYMPQTYVYTDEKVIRLFFKQIPVIPFSIKNKETNEETKITSDFFPINGSVLSYKFSLPEKQQVIFFPKKLTIENQEYERVVSITCDDGIPEKQLPVFDTEAGQTTNKVTLNRELER